MQRCIGPEDKSTTRYMMKSGMTKYRKVSRKASYPADTVRIRNQQYSLDERRKTFAYDRPVVGKYCVS